MTQAQLGKKITSTLNTWVTKMVAKFYDNVKRYGEAEARRIWREEYGLVFRRQYTVPARFYGWPGFADDLPASSKKTLLAQQKRPAKAKVALH
jgi:hypothetical protein